MLIPLLTRDRLPTSDSWDGIAVGFLGNGGLHQPHAAKVDPWKNLGESTNYPWPCSMAMPVSLPGVSQWIDDQLICRENRRPRETNGFSLPKTNSCKVVTVNLYKFAP
jgi:hypothetical protein